MSQSQRSQRTPKSQRSKSNKSVLSQRSQVDDGDSEIGLNERWTDEELVKNVLLYFFVMQNKGIPLKKLDIIKHAMNRQTPQFKMVMDEVADTLNVVFGVRLIGFRGTNEIAENVTDGQFFMIISNYKKCALNVGDLMHFEHLEERHLKVGLLRTVLSCLYMLHREMDESELWNIFEKTEASALVCPRKEDFRKFLKQEYVDSMYLQRVEIKGVDGSAFRYSWGLRAEVECDKYQLLKAVARQMKRSPYDFRLQLVELMTDDTYTEAIQEDYERWGERPEPQEEREEGQRPSEDEDTDEELLDIPDSNRCNVASALQPEGKSQPERQPIGRRARVVESDSDSA